MEKKPFFVRQTNSNQSNQLNQLDILLRMLVALHTRGLC